MDINGIGSRTAKSKGIEMKFCVVIFAICWQSDKIRCAFNGFQIENFNYYRYLG